MVKPESFWRKVWRDSERGVLLSQQFPKYHKKLLKSFCVYTNIY